MGRAGEGGGEADRLSYRPKDGQIDMLYSLKDVAGLVGVHPQTLKRHIYETKELAGIGQRVGKSLVFDEAALAQVREVLAGLPSRGTSGLTSSQVHERQDKALKMQEAGHSLSAIAKALGWADSTGPLKAIRAAKERRDKTATAPPKKSKKK
jgi:hypothetical protein